MADKQIQVRNGAVALPTGYLIDYQSYSVNESQTVDETTPYGTNHYTRHLGTGILTMSGSCSGFAKMGSTSNNPGFGSGNAAGGDIGAVATFTIDTGVTIVAPVIISGISLSHSRIRPGAPVSLSWIATAQGTQDPSTTWV